MTLDAGGVNRILDRIEQQMDVGFSKMEADIKALEKAVTILGDTKVSKAEYEGDRAIRRMILMWGLGIIVTVAIATWTIVASRPEVVVQSLGLG